MCVVLFILFQQVPFYIMTESYGGKMTAVIADQLIQVSYNLEYQYIFTKTCLTVQLCLSKNVNVHVTLVQW